MLNPELEASMLTDLTISFIDSTIFLKTTPYSNLASNIYLKMLFLIARKN